jgi:hypothetical protein
LKAIVLPGFEIDLAGAHSISLKDVGDGDRPEVFLTRTDGTGINPELTNHTKVINSGRGIAKLSNIGFSSIEVETPAPGMADPRRAR